MKTFTVSIAVILISSTAAFSQLVFRHHYFQTDLANFETYRLAGFTINGERADPEASSQLSTIQSKLHESLSKGGFEQAMAPDMLVFLLLEVDTLGTPGTKPAPEVSRELMAGFTIDIRQNPGFEKIFKGTVNGLVVTDDKSEKRLKKIYRKFFASFER